ncbi:methyltransferase-like 26 [Panonychus citri]|uniref:methyltransferase-like 26 n=1 Tax=Panonychus citri TaxID=50023 RepID=UPI002307B8D3|nr:methyltransferase-like 26 [Panonychus citri]
MRLIEFLVVRLFNCVKMLQAPAAERNKNPILSILRKVLPPDVQLNGLEIASGTGQHVTWFASNLPNIIWQPTEYDQSSLASIRAYRESNDEIKSRVKPPELVDVTKPLDLWPQQVAKLSHYDFILNVNMIHISPYECTIGLFRSGQQLIKENGLIILYGPFSIDGILTPESNVNFDQSLRARDSSWGVRDTRDVGSTAHQFGFRFVQIYDMPANNKILIYRKSSP